MPSVSLSATPLNAKLSFVSSISQTVSLYTTPWKHPSPVLYRLPLSKLLCWTQTNRKPSFYRKANQHFSCNRKAGLSVLSNAWLPGKGGGCFNMAAASTRSGNSGIFWMNGGMLTFPKRLRRPCPAYVYIYNIWRSKSLWKSTIDATSVSVLESFYFWGKWDG